MKKAFIILALLAAAVSMGAQTKTKADTTIVAGRVRFVTEVWTSKDGKTKTTTSAEYNGETYHSNKESARRDKEIRRYKGVPTYALIVRGDYKRIVVL